MEKECMLCGTKFTPNKRTPYQLYCSTKCGYTARNRRAVETGKKSEYGKTYREKHPEKKKQQDANYVNSWRYGGNKYNVLDRDGHKCTECGCDNPKALVIHHIDEDITHNDMSNLVTLCRACHARHHHSGKSNPKYKSVSKEDVEKAISITPNLEEAANYLGITRKTLAKKRKEYNLPMLNKHGKEI